MRVKLNALQKDSSACYSKVIEISTKEDLKRELELFDTEVPFLRWYDEHEADDDDNLTVHLLARWLEEIDNEK